jgi:hypothetical protein
MSLEFDILSDLQQLLQEHGVQARWNNINLLVLVSRNRNEQQLDIGGFFGSPDLSCVFLSSHFLQPCRNS